MRTHLYFEVSGIKRKEEEEVQSVQTCAWEWTRQECTCSMQRRPLYSDDLITTGWAHRLLCVPHWDTVMLIMSLSVCGLQSGSDAAWREPKYPKESCDLPPPPGRGRPSRQQTPTSAVVTLRSQTAQCSALKLHSSISPTPPTAADFRISEPISFWWKQKLTAALELQQALQTAGDASTLAVSLKLGDIFTPKGGLKTALPTYWTTGFCCKFKQWLAGVFFFYVVKSRQKFFLCLYSFFLPPTCTQTSKIMNFVSQCEASSVFQYKSGYLYNHISEGAYFRTHWPWGHFPVHSYFRLLLFKHIWKHPIITYWL